MSGAVSTAMAEVLVEPVRVLLVDDTPDLRLLLRLALERHGGLSVVAEAGDGREGVDRAREHQPDVVLLDLAMPRMDGLQALPLIRQVSPHSVVIVLSGFDAERMASPALAAGAHAFLRKGIDPQQLVATIAGALDRPLPRSEPVARPVREALPPPAARRPPEPVHGLDDAHRVIARVAHELRNPTVALSMLAEELALYRDSLSPELIDHIVAGIGRQAGVIDQITNDLLTASKARRGALVVHVRPVLVAEVVAEAVAAAGLESPWVVHVSCPEDLVVRADRVRLQQQLANLLTNAVRYGAPPLEVEVRRGEEHAELRVRDHGDGVPEWFRDQLFQEYARAQPDRGTGSGIGLFLVRSLAVAQGGDAWYDASAPGATFCIAVPLAGAAVG